MDDASEIGRTGLLNPQPRDLLEQKLLARKNVPVLADGTPLSELVDIKNREIKLRVFDDPELHRMEMDRIWAKAWVPVCHETDLPNVGDYKRGYIGEDRVIVTRAADRSINVVLNVCSHRAMEVCWSDEGNTNQFKCPYHGWVFDLKGKLLGAPFEKEEYGNWDKSKFPLKRATVASRHGVHFATFNPNPPSLEDYLTEFVGYFDLMFGSHEMVSTGMDLFSGLGDTIPANWKAVAEQNTGDGYHGVTLHRVVYEMNISKGGTVEGWGMDCYDSSSTGGHGLRVFESAASVDFGGVPGTAQPFPFGWFIAGSMFPSCGAGMNARMIETKSGKKVPMWMAHLFARTPNGVKAAGSAGFSLSVINKEFRDAMMSGDIDMSGMGPGLNALRIAFGNDDPESWASETRVSNGAVSRTQTIKYNTLEGASEPPDFPKGLGLVHRGVTKDDNQWHFWLAYYDWMTRD